MRAKETDAGIFAGRYSRDKRLAKATLNYTKRCFLLLFFQLAGSVQAVTRNDPYGGGM